MKKISDMNTRYYDLRREIVKAERRIAVLTERGGDVGAVQRVQDCP